MYSGSHSKTTRSPNLIFEAGTSLKQVAGVSPMSSGMPCAAPGTEFEMFSSNRTDRNSYLRKRHLRELEVINAKIEVRTPEATCMRTGSGMVYLETMTTVGTLKYMYITKII